jgi:hypothetical protein
MTTVPRQDRSRKPAAENQETIWQETGKQLTNQETAWKETRKSVARPTGERLRGKDQGGFAISELFSFVWTLWLCSSLHSPLFFKFYQ